MDELYPTIRIDELLLADHMDELYPTVCTGELFPSVHMDELYLTVHMDELYPPARIDNLSQKQVVQPKVTEPVPSDRNLPATPQ